MGRTKLSPQRLSETKKTNIGRIIIFCEGKTEKYYFDYFTEIIKKNKYTDIEVVCIIDKNPQQVLGDFRVISPKENIPKVDAVIVTADYYFAEIKKQMEDMKIQQVYLMEK